MGLNIHKTPAGTGKMSWLGSRHGVTNARTVTIDGATVAQFANKGFIPAGTPLTAGDKGKFKPANADGSEPLAGFVLTDQKHNGASDIVAPMLDHGRINVDRLPVKYTAPADAGAFIFVKNEGDA